MYNATSNREYGVDLLRSVSMLFIVLLHTLGHGGVLDGASGINYCAAQLINCMAYCGVNCFAIISGYVTYDRNTSEHRWGQFFTIWCQAIYYNVVLYIVSYFAFKTELSINGVLKSFTPISHNTYWYLTAYFIVFLLSPLIIEMTRRNSKRQDKICFVSGLLLMYLSHTLTGYFAATLLIVLFYIGAIIKKYSIGSKITKKRAATTFICCHLFTWGWKIGFHLSGLSEIGKISIRYDSPVIILMAIMLLVIFINVYPIEYGQRIIKLVTPSVFSVYLLNDNPFIREYLIRGRFSTISNKPTIVMICLLVGFSVLFFILSICLDLIRRKLFELFRFKDLFLKLEYRYESISLGTCNIIVKWIYSKRN